MGVKYEPRSNKPLFKFGSSLTPTTAFAVWTPSTSTRIALTDVTISAANAGTVQIRFGNIGGDIVEEFILAGSVTVGRSNELPAISPIYDRAVFAEASMNGYVGVSLKGLEED